MSCDRYRNALTEAAAGDATAPALAAHLEGCAMCRSELAELRRLMAAADESLSALATAEPSPALRARIRQGVTLAQESSTSELPWRGSWAWPAAAAAVLALVALGVWRPVAGRAPAGSAVARRTPSVAVAENVRGMPEPTSSWAAGAVAPAGAETPRPTASPLATTGPKRPAPVARAMRHPSCAGPVPVRAARRAEPEVLVAAGGQEALLRLVALVHREGLVAPALSAAGEPSPNLAEPKPISIRPLDIVPLDPADDSET